MSQDHILHSRGRTVPRAARKRPSRRLQRIPTPLARLTVLAIIAAALLVGVVGLGLKAARPYRMAGRENERLALIQGQINALSVKNEVLQSQIAYMKTPAGIAAEAHRLGYMRPDERPLVILGLPAAPTNDETGGNPPVAITPASPPTKASFLHRFWRHLCTL